MVKNPPRPIPSKPYACTNGQDSISRLALAFRAGRAFGVSSNESSSFASLSFESSSVESSYAWTSESATVLTPVKVSTKLSSLKSCAVSSSSSEELSSDSESSDVRRSSSSSFSSFSSSSSEPSLMPSTRLIRRRTSTALFASTLASKSLCAAATRFGGRARMVTLELVFPAHTAANCRTSSYASGPTCTSTELGVIQSTTSSSHA
mmetsp:Transcript_6377/g.21403  ORF Transcript_6377/g.21403 Transcript_6377/m.21403 type:complete len:206 (-) Transcript_6377:220-837(-)